MAEWIKALATKPDILCSIPGTHMVEEEINSCKLFSGLHLCTIACMTSPQLLTPQIYVKLNIKEISS